MHWNFEGSTDSPLEKSFLSKMATKSSVVQHWEIFSCSSINHSFPFKSRSWFLGGILVVWEICVSIPRMSFLVIQKLIYLPVHPQFRSSFIPFCINLSMSFNWVSAVSYLAFFLWWVDLLFLWSLLLSRIFPWWLLTFWVLVGKTVGVWLLTFWEHLFGPLLHNCFPFCFRIKRFRVLNAFVSTSVELHTHCGLLFLGLGNRWPQADNLWLTI